MGFSFAREDPEAFRKRQQKQEEFEVQRQLGNLRLALPGSRPQFIKMGEVSVPFLAVELSYGFLPENLAALMMGIIEEINPKLAAPALMEQIAIADKRKLTFQGIHERAHLAAAIGKFGDDTLVNGLLRIANGSKAKPISRIVAIQALGELKSRKAIRALTALLSDESPAIVKTAADALGKFAGKTAGETLLDALREIIRTWELHGMPMTGYDQYSGKEAVSEEVAASLACISALGKVKYQPAKFYLSKLLVECGYDEIKAACAKALGEIGAYDKDVAKALLDAAANSNKKISIPAINSLISIGTGALPVLMEGLVSINSQENKVAKECIIGIGAPAVMPIIRAMQKGKLNKISGIVILGKLKDARAIPCLLEELKSPYKILHEGAIQALGEIGDPSAAPDVAAFLPDAELHKYARAALIAMGAGTLVLDYLFALMKAEPVRREELTHQIRGVMEEMSRVRGVTSERISGIDIGDLNLHTRLAMSRMQRRPAIIPSIPKPAMISSPAMA